MTPADRDAAVALANLRHAYAQLHEGRVRDQREFACGLLGPAIKTLERALAERPTCETCRYWTKPTSKLETCGQCQRGDQGFRHRNWFCADHLPAPRVTCSICRRDDCAQDHACE